MTEFLTAWSPDPLILVSLGVFGALYAVGWQRLSRRGDHRAGLRGWQAVSYGAALLVLAAALLGPLDVYGSRLFFIHMIQHLLLLFVIPPLLWLGAPLLPTLWGLPDRERAGAARLLGPRGPLHWLFHQLSAPMAALGIYIVTIAVWHLPPLYDAAQGRGFVHDVEHLSFFGAGLLFWWPVIHPSGGRRRLGLGPAIFYLLPPLLEGNLLGALLTFSPQALYQTYVLAPRTWGLSALEDQQIGGLLMWVLGGMMWMIPLFAVIAAFLQGEERRAQMPVPTDS